MFVCKTTYLETGLKDIKRLCRKDLILLTLTSGILKTPRPLYKYNVKSFQVSNTKVIIKYSHRWSWMGEVFFNIIKILFSDNLKIYVSPYDNKIEVNNYPNLKQDRNKRRVWRRPTEWSIVDNYIKEYVFWYRKGST